MSFPNPFRRKDENTRHTWGYDFQWTPFHTTEEETRHLKYSYDTLADECLDRLDIISPPTSKAIPSSKNQVIVKEGETPAAKRDLYQVLRDHHSEDEKLDQLWNEVTTVPDWVDWDQIARGQDVFYRYGGPALTALAYQSLLGGMGAARITEVLARTGGFGPKVAKGRLYETTQHIIQVTASLESIKPLGEGFASSLRVRLLHASVRRRILALAKQKPSYYSVENYGIPINDLDCIGTIATFSSTLIWIGFPRQGIYLRQQEIVDYLALWRLVAFYMGTPTDFLAIPEKARAIMESLMIEEIKPSNTSRTLANNIIVSLQNQPPAYASRDFLIASARWLNGDELADELALDRVSIWYKGLVFGQCVFFCGLCYLYRSVTYLDRKKITALRKFLPDMIIHNKSHGLGQPTVFDFKFIPSHDFIATEKGEYIPGIGGKGVETRNFRALAVFGVVTAVALGGAGWIGWRVAMGLVGSVDTASVYELASKTWESLALHGSGLYEGLVGLWGSVR